MSRRRLSPEERDLWDRVRARATPLRPAPAFPRPAPAPVPAPAPAPPPPPLAPFRLGERAAPRATAPAAPAPPPLRMDAATFRRLARGRAEPEARLDLHGMTLAEAHDALTGWLLAQRARGRRLVLVITGKGREGRGSLRRDVPRWLALPPLAGAVIDVAPAHRRHGGEGALYVRLRGP